MENVEQEVEAGEVAEEEARVYKGYNGGKSNFILIT